MMPKDRWKRFLAWLASIFMIAMFILKKKIEPIIMRTVFFAHFEVLSEIVKFQTYHHLFPKIPWDMSNIIVILIISSLGIFIITPISRYST